MNNRWQLAVYTEDGEEIVQMDKYIKNRLEDRVNWQPSIEDSAIILETQGREWLASEWNLGNIRKAKNSSFLFYTHSNIHCD